LAFDVSTGSSPPAQPPMMSPDGKWVWNGQKWIPVAVHESVFHQYTDAVAAAQAEAPLAETMVTPPVNPFSTVTPGGVPASPFASPPSGYTVPPRSSAPAVVSPAISAPMSYTTGDSVPPWQQWASGGRERSRTMYLAGAFIAVVLGVILLIYFGMSEIPFLRADNQNGGNASPAATPMPQLTARSDSAVAGRYVAYVINPAVDVINQPLTNYIQACNGTLSFSCEDALNALKDATDTALSRFATPPPPCIGTQVAKVKQDLIYMQTGVARALKGYNDNNRDELLSGLGTFNNGAHPLVTVDAKAVAKAQTACDDQPQGP
jgi:hypothetical protein